ncbi:MAG: serine/threonine protein kinase [Myxococcales bacterium]|nr:serine/threonine protein kinase [Myxococcales bacterium]
MSMAQDPTQAIERRDEQPDCFAQEGLPRRFGRFHLLRLLARGGMGQVFLASSIGVEGAERPLIIKVIRREHARDPNFLARFLDEARVQSQLQHSGVAQILEAAIHEPTGDPYVALEYVEGRSLGNVRRRMTDVGFRVGWADAVALGNLICEGLAHIHERTDPSGKPLGIVHRDLSPHNVMVGYAGEVKIIDFGTARGQNRRCHTVAGVVFAKPGYVAPEVANGNTGDHRVDLYAAGVMIWELCAGRRFLQGEAPEHMARVAAGERDLPPIADVIRAPLALDRVLAKMTATRREDRYESTHEAAVELAALLRESEPLANGERGVRARTAQLMYALYPNQPGRARREFARLVAEARAKGPDEWFGPAELEREATPHGMSLGCPAAADESELLPGTRYRLGSELGRGASSVVYRAEHIELGRRVAVKILDAEHTHSKEFSARFRREARTLSRLAHPGLVRVHDFGQATDGRLFCAMELLEGESLRCVLDSGEPISWRRALRFVLAAASALEVAHRAGIVHRDIKPENLFVTKTGQLKVVDFGLAKLEGEIGDGDGRSCSESNSAMTLFGTPEYIAPEQIAGGHADARADLYSLGCVLHELLTGSVPFADAAGVALLDRKRRGNPESVRASAPMREIPRAVDALVTKLLARHPSRRPADTAELCAAITACLEAPSREQARRRMLGGSLFAAVMGFGIILLAAEARPFLGQLPAHMPWLSETSDATLPARALPKPANLAPTRVPAGRSAEQPVDHSREEPLGPPRSFVPAERDHFSGPSTDNSEWKHAIIPRTIELPITTLAERDD